MYLLSTTGVSYKIRFLFLELKKNHHNNNHYHNTVADEGTQKYNYVHKSTILKSLQGYTATK